MADYNERRPIKGFPNYEVDGYGNVYSVDHHTVVVQQKGRQMPFVGRKLKPGFTQDGYMFVGMMDDTHKLRTRRVHRLVAEAFIPNPDNLPTVNHKDENKQNNCIDNLEWASWGYNTIYGTANERRSKKLLGRKIANSRPVMGRRATDTRWTYYPSGLQAAKASGTTSGGVSAVCKGRAKTANGYVFRYAEPSEVNEYAEHAQK